MSNLTQTDELFFNRVGLDQNRLETLVDDALTGADDGELFLEYRQSEGLAVHQLVQIAGQLVDHIGAEGRRKRVLKHQPDETSDRTQVDVSGDYSGCLHLFHQSS